METFIVIVVIGCAWALLNDKLNQILCAVRKPPAGPGLDEAQENKLAEDLRGASGSLKDSVQTNQPKGE